jgi:hypothetical protein
MTPASQRVGSFPVISGGPKSWQLPLNEPLLNLLAAMARTLGSCTVCQRLSMPYHFLHIGDPYQEDSGLHGGHINQQTNDRGSILMRSTAAVGMPLIHSLGVLFEKVLINISYFKDVFNSAPDIMTDHQHGKLLSVDENDLLTEKVSCFSRGMR